MRNNEQNGRRAFLRHLARGVTLAALVGGVATLVARKGETCVNQGICRDCTSLRDCKLPQAKSLKQAQSRRR